MRQRAHQLIEKFTSSQANEQDLSYVGDKMARPLVGERSNHFIQSIQAQMSLPKNDSLLLDSRRSSIYKESYKALNSTVQKRMVPLQLTQLLSQEQINELKEASSDGTVRNLESPSPRDKPPRSDSQMKIQVAKQSGQKNFIVIEDEMKINKKRISTKGSSIAIPEGSIGLDVSFINLKPQLEEN